MSSRIVLIVCTNCDYGKLPFMKTAEIKDKSEVSKLYCPECKQLKLKLIIKTNDE